MVLSRANRITRSLRVLVDRFPAVAGPLCVLPAEHHPDEPRRLLGGAGVQRFDAAALDWNHPHRSRLGVHDGVQWTAGQGGHHSAVPAVAQVVQHFPIQHQRELRVFF